MTTTPEEVAVLLERVASRLMRRLHQHLRRCEFEPPVSMVQMRVMAMALHGRPTLSQVARALHVRRPTATRLVDGLVQRGWLEREHDPHDRRQVRLHTTPAGAAVQARIQDVVHAVMAEHLSQVPAEDLQALFRGLQALSAVLEGEGRPGTEKEGRDDQAQGATEPTLSQEESEERAG